MFCISQEMKDYVLKTPCFIGYVLLEINYETFEFKNCGWFTKTEFGRQEAEEQLKCYEEERKQNQVYDLPERYMLIDKRAIQ